MVNDDYYDYSNYYDQMQFDVVSIVPGWPVLLATTAYTAICITIGFLFICRKKKWRNKDKDEFGSPTTSQAWLDPSPYMCAVDEVVGNTFFDQEHVNDLDDNSIESDDSNKALEYFFGKDENSNATPEEVEAETSYKLFTDGGDNSGKSGNSADKSIELSDMDIENPSESRSIESDDAKSRTSEFPKRPISTTESFMDDPVPAPTPKVRCTSLKDLEKKAEPRKLVGRKSRRFRSKKRERKAVSLHSFGDHRNKQLGGVRIFHGPNSLEIELREEAGPPASRPKKLLRFSRSSKLSLSESTSTNEGSPHSNNQSTTQYSRAGSSLSDVQQDKDSEPSSRKSNGLLSRFRHAKSSKKREDDSGPNDKAELNTSDDKSVNVDRSGEGNDTFQKEMIEINKLAIPWTASSFIEYFASMLAIALISSYMSVAAMICYSYVWFILEAAFMFSGALYNSLYKHVNNSIALETKEGYFKAGKYIRISIIINTIISIPVSIGMIFAMGPIIRFYGFEDGMVALCNSYTYIAVIHNFASTTSGFISITTDIDGFADFNAKYAVFHGLVDIAISAFVIPFVQPSLAQLGLIYFVHDMVSTLIYYYLTWYKWDWFCNYKKGMQAPITFDRKDKKAVSTLIKKSIPMLFDELNGELEWLVSAYFAAYLGSAESASWILLSYIWGFIGVVPSCIGSAAECRVSHQLSKGNIEVAKQVSNRCMFLTGITSVAGTGILFLLKKPVISFITGDYDLETMLMGVMPYILLCQPMVSLTTTGAYLNRALAMYQRSTKIELLVTCVVTLPLAGVSTFIFGYNISGLVAASFIGYATMGLVILAIYNNADWEKAVRKNKKIAGEVESSKLDTSVDTMDTQNASNSSFNSAEVVGVLV